MQGPQVLSLPGRPGRRNEPPPFGLGLTAVEVEALIESKPLAQQLAADPDVRRGPENGEIGRGRNSTDNIRPNSAHGTSAEYLVRRLKRDAPEVAEALANGEFKSARAGKDDSGSRLPDQSARSYLA